MNKSLLTLIRCLAMGGGGAAIGDGLFGHKSTAELIIGALVFILGFAMELFWPSKPPETKPTNPTPLIK